MIGVCGFGYTGSGAVNDFLKEFDNVYIYDQIEFDFVYAPDGIEDLYYHLCENPVRYLSGNSAIKRFVNMADDFSRHTSLYMKATKGKYAIITQRYIDSLVQAKWSGYDIYEKISSSPWKKTCKYRIGGRIDALLEKITGSKAFCFSYSDMYLSVKPEKFLEISKQYLRDIMRSMGITEGGNVVLNQPFPSNNPGKYYKYYDNPVAIIVDRDPRDQYILAKKILLGDGSFIPTDDVQSFVMYYKKMHESIDCECFHICFEDFVYEYEATKRMMMERFNLGSHVYPRKYFNPEISINNTQLFRRYPEFSDDINVIESALGDYLYDYGKYGKIKFTGRSF